MAGALFQVAAFAALVGVLILATSPQAAPTSSITIQAFEFVDGDPVGAPIPKFKYLVNVDNVGDPADPNPLNRPGRHPMASDSPLVAAGDQSSATLTLPDGKYILTVQGNAPRPTQPLVYDDETPFDYKLWGKHIEVSGGNATVVVELKKYALPLPNLVVHAFHDDRWVNSAPDLPGEDGLAGFEVVIKDQGGAQVVVDHNGDPLCGGLLCLTDADGNVTIENLSPAWYEVEVIPPDGDGWIQTSTFEGGFPVGVGLEEGSDGAGAPLEALVEPGLRTANWFGFVKEMDWASPGAGSITGTALTYEEWPPFSAVTNNENEPVPEPYVALSDMATDEQVWTGRGALNGDFTIPSVPAGSYMLTIWDYDLQWIIRFQQVTVGGDQPLDVDLGEVGVGRWFGWLSGDVYLDTNKNGKRDPGEVAMTNPGTPLDLDVRWRDGSIDAATAADPSGHYEFPQAEGGPVGRFQIGEVGFGRFGTTGAALHDEYDPFAPATPVPAELSGGLLTNQFSVPGHRSIVDWGKYPYASNETGAIVGIAIQGVTRNELDARLQAAEDYETGMADVTVRLWSADETKLLYEVQTDRWGHPSGCDIRGVPPGALVPDTANVGEGCIEVPTIGTETKDGAFDGGFAFSAYCPAGYSEGCAEAPIVPGDYVVEAVTPESYQVVREEDVNVNDGDDLVPQILPPPCVGEMHTVDVKSVTTPDGDDPGSAPDVYAAPDGSNPVDNPTFALQTLANGPGDGDGLGVGGSPYEGAEMPLCNKRLVTLEQGQNAEANFFLFPKNGLENPGRILGLVTDDIYFDTNPNSMWYGEARPLRDVPVGIRDYSGRLITTLKSDENGFYEVLLPSTQTANCPIPQGICPGLYVVVVNDPGSKASPNKTFNPNYLTAAVTLDVWPGKTTQADTPLDPISGVACVPPPGVPEFFSVDKVVIPAGSGTTNAQRTFTIRGLNLGLAPGAQGRVRIEGPVGGPPTGNRNLDIINWSPDSITARVPLLGAGSPAFRPGAYELTVRSGGSTAVARTAINGVTLHVTGSTVINNQTVTYNPTIFEVDPPATITSRPLQAGIDAAEASGDAHRIVVVKPGVYTENVIVSERIKLQGFGPGGIVGADGVNVEDPRRNVAGSVIDGRFFPENSASWRSKLDGLDIQKESMEVPGGADITVVAKVGESFDQSFRAQIDGFGLTSARAVDPYSAGGIYVHARARNLRITNNVVEGNGGASTGGIGLGQPGQGTNDNTGIEIRRNRIVGNGGYTDTGGGGGIGIHNGASNYVIRFNQICSNFSVHYGGGISHFGSSPGGTILDNVITYNDAIDEGGGIQISGQPSANPDVLGIPSGGVAIERNLIQGNASNDDGGGIHLLEALGSEIIIRNNMIVNNHAADIGGGVSLDDSSGVKFNNNTVAYNDTTASAEDSEPGVAHGAGFTSTANSILFQASLPPTAPTFSRPQTFFNNIFWENQAWTFDVGTQALTDAGIIDLEVVGTPTTELLSPSYSILSVPYSGPGSTNNLVGTDPNFVDDNGATNELMVQINRLSPAEVIVTLVRGDPPQGLLFNYHLTGATAGGLTSQSPSDDYDRGNRPAPRDRGADEYNEGSLDKFAP